MLQKPATHPFDLDFAEIEALKYKIFKSNDKHKKPGQPSVDEAPLAVS